MSLALLFPGQGVQYAGMLPWLEAEPEAVSVIAEIRSNLGDDWRARSLDEDWSSSNQIAQPLMTGVALAAWQALKNRLPRPAVVAGYSVGELAAFSMAGLFDAKTALALARRRAELMDASGGAQPGGLLSVRGLGVAKMGALCARSDLAIAISLGDDHCIVGGTLTALAAAMPALQEAGAELTPLRVRVASHTRAMAAAAIEFAATLQPMQWPHSNCVVVCDLDGVGRRDALSLKHALARQIDHTVAWRRCMTTIAERQPRCVLEVGPGTTLSRLWAASFPQIPARSVDEFQGADAIVDWVERALARD